MTEYSVEPFGNSNEMPAGINVINGLDSDSIRNALSAYQGKRLKEMIDAKADDNAAITRYSVNLCESVTSGVLNSSGAAASGSGLVTDFIPIVVGSGTKTQYLHVCASVFKTYAFGYRAVSVCTYSASKTYIGTISSVSAVIDKESQANATLFANAEYIRVQFATGTTDHYVALSNKPVLPQYSPFDKDSLTALTDAAFQEIHNTDGAITNMIDTALDYVNNHTALGLGYGDSATAYDESCDAVTPDPWNTGAYSGEKKQINCSTFVQLCLEGVRYANSRYALGTSAKNHGNGYVFDDKVETNYHNALESDTSAWSQYSFARHIPCSTHNKLYANKQLKYALDRGFAYLIDDGFKNVEVGDVIFVSNSSGTYKDVGHALFVSAVSLKSDGTKIISIMEDRETGISETTGITTRNSQWVYAARFQLPHITSKASNIVSEITNSTYTLPSSGNTAVIGTLALTENVKAHGIYTAIVKCSAVGDFEVMVGTVSGSTFTPLSTNGDTLFRRGDGVTVKHIHLPVNSSVNTNSLAVAIKAYGTLSSSVTIVSAKVFNGYVTE